MSKRINALEQLKAQLNLEFSNSPSPFTFWVKPTIIHADAGKITFRYKVRKEMTNPIGTLHGGVTAAIIDDIIGVTMYSLNEDFFYTTLNNVVDYFYPAFENDIIFADTLIVKKGRQVVNVQCEVWNENRSRLLARAYSNLIKTSIKK